MFSSFNGSIAKIELGQLFLDSIHYFQKDFFFEMLEFCLNHQNRFLSNGIEVKYWLTITNVKTGSVN